MSQNKIPFLEEAIKESPTEPFLYFALAKELEKNNQPLQALEQYNHLITHFPEYGGTYYHVVRLLIQEGKDVEALPILQKGLSVLYSSGETNLWQELNSLKSQLFDQ